jgi:hypothetical protein
MMAEPWRDLVRGFDGVDPPLDLLRQVEQREARLEPSRPRRWHLPRAAGWALAAAGIAVVVVALALAAHSRRSQPAAGTVTASPEQLAILRRSFSIPTSYHRVPVSSAAAGIPGLPYPLPRPDSPLASDRTLDSVWVANNRNAVLIWKSGVVELVQVWRCHCPLSSAFSRFPPGGFKPLTITGSDAVAIAAGQPVPSIGPVSPAERKYGTPSAVEMIRSGLSVSLFQYGNGTLPGLIAAARTVPNDTTLGQVINDGRTRIVGGTPAQRVLLGSIMRGISSKDIAEVRVSTQGMLTLILTGGRANQSLGTWESWLVAGAFRELSRDSGLPEASGYSVDVPSAPLPLPNTFPQNASHPTSSVGAETLTVSIERRLAQARLSLVSLTFAKPFNLAPIVIARTYDPRAGAGWTPRGYPIQNDSRLEGSYFEVVDQSGKVVYFVAHATRTQSGMSNLGDLKHG